MGDTLGTASLVVYAPTIINPSYTWTVGDADLTTYNPILSGVSESSDDGSNTSGDTVDFEVLAPEISGTSHQSTIGYANVSAPVSSVSGEEGGLANLIPPVATISGLGYQTTYGTADLVVPSPILIGEPGAQALLSVPLTEISGLGLVGTTGQSSIVTPVVDVSSYGSVQTLGFADISTPRPIVSGSNSLDTFGSIEVLAPIIQISAISYQGTIGSANASAPLIQVSGSSFFHTTGDTVLTMPLVAVTGISEGSVILVDVEGQTEDQTGFALVINLGSHAITEYDNYGFESFARFNGHHLGANESGIFSLSGNTDNGTKIRSKIRTGLQDGRTDLRKGIEDAFLGMSADNAMTVKVITDGYNEYDGRLDNPRDVDAITQRVKFGKGIRSRYLGIEIENRNGCDFTLESAELVAVPLTRKL